MAGIAAHMKDLKRRGLQKVLQGMGIAEKTTDESHSQAYHNFETLGNFLAHFKQSVQGASASLEKVTKLQGNIASDIQAYLHSELSGDTDAPTGELLDFFHSQDEEASTHAVMLQEVAERFYYACNDVTNSVLQNMLHGLHELVITPITRDEELNIITKELTEEHRKLNLDYDAYRRAAQTAAPSDHERLEAKVRASKEKFDISSKRMNDHLSLRNYNRSKIIIHTVLSLVQQYNNFFVTTSTLFQEITGVLNPLLSHYQMDERQFLDMLKQDVRPARHHGASVPTTATPKQRSPSPPRSPRQQHQPQPQPQPQPKPAVPPKPTHHARNPSPPHSPPLNGNGNGNGSGNGATNPTPTPNPNPAPPPKPKESPLVDDLMGDHSDFKPPPTSSPIPPTSKPAPTSNVNIFDSWEGKSGRNDATFVDTSFGEPPLAPNASSPIPPHANAQPKSGGGGGLFDDPLLFDFGKPSTTPLKPQPAANNTFVPPQPAKPAAGNTGFGVPPQPQPTYKATPNYSNFNNVPPQQPNYMGAKPPGYGGPFSQPGFGPQGAPYGHGGQPGFMPGFGGPQAGHGGFVPPGPGGRGYNTGFPPGPGASPYTNPPNAGAGFFAQPDSDGLDSATASKIRQWAEKGGKKTNLRGLISSMHEVLWAESGWEQKGLGELVSPAQVKKAYRQATLIVHPDKVTSCTEEQKLIAKRVFECLRESYESFKNEPQ